MAEKLIGCFLVLISILYLILALNLEKRGFTTGELGPEVFPIVLSATLFVLGVLLLINETLLKEKVASVSSGTDRDKMMILLSILLMAAYIIFLPTVGFLISTPIFLILCSLLYRVPNWQTAMGTGIVTTLILYGVFTKLFRIMLP